jgi:Xaa-Pro aminopeptidase
MKIETYAKRRKAFFDTMQDGSIAFLLAGTSRNRSNDTDYTFSINRDFFYLTGRNTPGELLFLTKQVDKQTETLFIQRPTEAYERYHGKQAAPDSIKEESGIEKVLYLDELEKELGKTLEGNEFHTSYFDFRPRVLGAPQGEEDLLAARVTGSFPWLQAANANPVLTGMRRIKTPEEIDYIREAIRITGLGIEALLSELAPGVSEKQLEARFEYAIKIGGATNGYAFHPIVASGANSIVLHYEDNNRTLQDGELLLVDLGAEYENYAGDISRTFPVNGKFTDEQRFFHDAVIAAQNVVFERLRAGVENKATEWAREAMFDACKQAGVANELDDMKKLLPHGVSHSLGLDVHDVSGSENLETGMVLTVEPCLYLPSLGFGIRIEDDVLITKEGCELLSPNILRTAEEIEAYMA